MEKRRYLYRALFAIGFMALASWAYWHPNGLRANPGSGIVVDASGNYYVAAPMFQTETNAAPIFNLSPSSITFGNQAVGTISPPQSITLSNSGNAFLFLQNISLTGDFRLQRGTCFGSIEQGPSLTTDDQKEGGFFALAPGQSCTVGIAFTPQSGGPKTGSVTFITNGGTRTVNLFGNIGGSVQFAATSFSVNENGGTATISVTRTGGIGPVSVSYFTANSTAQAGKDYNSTFGTLNFAGDGTQSFTVPIIDNNTPDGDRFFSVILSNPVNGMLGSIQVANVNIVDNDVAQPGQIQFSNAAFSVNENAGSAIITVTRTGGSNTSVSITFNTSDGTARAGFDYGLANGTLTFDPGVTSRTVNVRILEDSDNEGNETVNLLLSNPLGGAGLGAVSRAVLTIVDNDVPVNPPTLQVLDQVVDFGDVNVGQKATRTITVRNSGGGQLVLTPPTLSGGQSLFSISSPLSSLVLTQNQTATFSVDFNPRVISPDTISGLIAITSNGGTSTVAVRGRGVDNVGPTISILRPRPEISEIVTAGLPLIIQFSGVDNDAVSNFTVSFSTDDGATFPPQNLIGRVGPSSNQIIWNVPENLNTTQARIRVVAQDRSGNTTTLISNRFTIRRPLLEPVALTSGDFNSDGRLDLAAAISGSDIVAVLLGTGNAGFGPARFFTVGDRPVSIVAGDFNGDGRLDLATANQSSNDVSVLLGDGTGNFLQAASFKVGLSPNFIAVGNFNGDNLQDLVTANSRSNNVSILVSTGNSFNSAASFNAGLRPETLTVGDFNRDNLADVAVTSKTSFSIMVLLGDGTGRLGSANSFTLSGNPVPIVSGDFNGDGRLDLAAANGDFFNVSVLLSSDGGSFNQPTNFGTGANPVSMAIADFNRDSRLDLVTANFNSDNVSILLGTGMGSFGAATSFPAGGQPQSIVAGDFSGDGNPDVAVANQLTNNITILLGNGTGSLGQSQTVNIGAPVVPPSPVLQVVVRFDPPPAGQIAPPQNLRVSASEFRNTLTGITEEVGEAELTDDQQGDAPQLLGFNIFRVPAREDGTTPSPSEIVGDPNNLVGSVPAGTTTFMDTVSTSKGNNFVYSATSFFNNGSQSNGSNTAGTDLPVIKNPTFRNGTIFFEAAGSFIPLTGATLIVNDTENFQIRQDDTGAFFTVAKQAQSTPGGQRVKKLLRRGTPVRLTVRNPDGKLSVGVMFTRN
jgi:hypothetical protein